MGENSDGLTSCHISFYSANLIGKDPRMPLYHPPADLLCQVNFYHEAKVIVAEY
jgi:hypothetical protein